MTKQMSKEEAEQFIRTMKGEGVGAMLGKLLATLILLGIITWTTYWVLRGVIAIVGLI